VPPSKKPVPETVEQKLDRQRLQQLVDNRRMRFVELLGVDCGYIDALIVHTHISPWDVKELLDKGCPNELIPKILL